MLHTSRVPDTLWLCLSILLQSLLHDVGLRLGEKRRQSQRSHVYSMYQIACTCSRSATWGSVPQGAHESIPMKQKCLHGPRTRTDHPLKISWSAVAYRISAYFPIKLYFPSVIMGRWMQCWVNAPVNTHEFIIAQSSRNSPTWARFLHHNNDTLALAHQMNNRAQ